MYMQKTSGRTDKKLVSCEEGLGDRMERRFAFHFKANFRRNKSNDARTKMKQGQNLQPCPLGILASVLCKPAWKAVLPHPAVVPPPYEDLPCVPPQVALHPAPTAPSRALPAQHPGRARCVSPGPPPPQVNKTLLSERRVALSPKQTIS